MGVMAAAAGLKDIFTPFAFAIDLLHAHQALAIGMICGSGLLNMFITDLRYHHSIDQEHLKAIRRRQKPSRSTRR